MCAANQRAKMRSSGLKRRRRVAQISSAAPTSISSLVFLSFPITSRSQILAVSKSAEKLLDEIHHAQPHKGYASQIQ